MWSPTALGARGLLDTQAADGSWGADYPYGASERLVDTSFAILFLRRAVLSRTATGAPRSARIVDDRTTTGSSGGPGEVYLASKKKNVDACELLHLYAEAPQGLRTTTHDAAAEAVQALLIEGHGREACLFAPLAALHTRGDSERTAATRWLHDLEGRDVSPEAARVAGDRFEVLARARAEKDAKVLLQALVNPAEALANRAFAASALAALQCGDAVEDLIDATERLARDGGGSCLATGAGARAARILVGAITALARVPLATLEPRGPVPPASVLAIVTAAREGTRRAVVDCVDRALAAYAARGKDMDAWKRARAELDAFGQRALQRLVLIAADPQRSPAAFAALRSLTGEQIPDDLAAWKTYLERR